MGKNIGPFYGSYQDDDIAIFCHSPYCSNNEIIKIRKTTGFNYSISIKFKCPECGYTELFKWL